MQKSQITFAPVSFYALRKQKRPIDRLNEDPPPVLTKGSETEFDSGEEPPPPQLEAETIMTTTDDPTNEFAHKQNGSYKCGKDLSMVATSNVSTDRAMDDDESDDPTDSFILESRHLPSWFRNCPECTTNQKFEVLFRGRIAGAPQSGPTLSIECALCSTSIYNSVHGWEEPSARVGGVEHQSTKEPQSDCNSTDNELKPSTSAAIGGEKGTDDKPRKRSVTNNMKDFCFNQSCTHQFGLSFPVLFEAQDGQQGGHCERIAFRGFVYNHISRQVKTRGGGDSVSHWRCQQRIGPLNSNCTGLVRLEGKNLTFIKAHKHPPDYAAIRAVLSHVNKEYTRLHLVSSRKGRTKNSVEESAAHIPNSTPIILRPITDRSGLRRVTSQTERKAADNSTDEPTTMETEELIRSITARKELLTVKVSPST